MKYSEQDLRPDTVYSNGRHLRRTVKFFKIQRKNTDGEMEGQQWISYHVCRMRQPTLGKPRKVIDKGPIKSCTEVAFRKWMSVADPILTAVRKAQAIVEERDAEEAAKKEAIEPAATTCKWCGMESCYCCVECGNHVTFHAQHCSYHQE